MYLLIEYTLLVVECIKEIDKADFETRYLVNFANTLFEKGKKIKQYLKVLENLAIQDKIILKIELNQFEENKELIYSLMKDGFKFAIVLDNKFKYSDANVKKLEVFKYILVPYNIDCYYDFRADEDKINNVVIFDV